MLEILDDIDGAADQPRSAPGPLYVVAPRHVREGYFGLASSHAIIDGAQSSRQPQALAAARVRRGAAASESAASPNYRLHANKIVLLACRYCGRWCPERPITPEELLLELMLGSDQPSDEVAMGGADAIANNNAGIHAESDGTASNNKESCSPVLLAPGTVGPLRRMAHYCFSNTLYGERMLRASRIDSMLQLLPAYSIEAADERGPLPPSFPARFKAQSLLPDRSNDALDLNPNRTPGDAAGAWGKGDAGPRAGGPEAQMLMWPAGYNAYLEYYDADNMEMLARDGNANENDATGDSESLIQQSQRLRRRLSPELLTLLMKYKIYEYAGLGPSLERAIASPSAGHNSRPQHGAAGLASPNSWLPAGGRLSPLQEQYLNALEAELRHVHDVLLSYNFIPPDNPLCTPTGTQSSTDSTDNNGNHCGSCKKERTRGIWIKPEPDRSDSSSLNEMDRSKKPTIAIRLGALQELSRLEDNIHRTLKAERKDAIKKLKRIQQGGSSSGNYEDSPSNNEEDADSNNDSDDDNDNNNSNNNNRHKGKDDKKGCPVVKEEVLDTSEDEDSSDETHNINNNNKGEEKPFLIGGAPMIINRRAEAQKLLDARTKSNTNANKNNNSESRNKSAGSKKDGKENKTVSSQRATKIENSELYKTDKYSLLISLTMAQAQDPRYQWTRVTDDNKNSNKKNIDAGHSDSLLLPPPLLFVRNPERFYCQELFCMRARAMEADYRRRCRATLAGGEPDASASKPLPPLLSSLEFRPNINLEKLKKLKCPANNTGNNNSRNNNENDDEKTSNCDNRRPVAGPSEVDLLLLTPLQRWPCVHIMCCHLCGKRRCLPRRFPGSAGSFICFFSFLDNERQCSDPENRVLLDHLVKLASGPARGQAGAEKQDHGATADADAAANWSDRATGAKPGADAKAEGKRGGKRRARTKPLPAGPAGGSSFVIKPVADDSEQEASPVAASGQEGCIEQGNSSKDTKTEHAEAASDDQVLVRDRAVFCERPPARDNASGEDERKAAMLYESLVDFMAKFRAPGAGCSGEDAMAEAQRIGRLMAGYGPALSRIYGAEQCGKLRTEFRDILYHISDTKNSNNDNKNNSEREEDNSIANKNTGDGDGSTQATLIKKTKNTLSSHKITGNGDTRKRARSISHDQTDASPATRNAASGATQGGCRSGEGSASLKDSGQRESPSDGKGANGRGATTIATTNNSNNNDNIKNSNYDDATSTKESKGSSSSDEYLWLCCDRCDKWRCFDNKSYYIKKYNINLNNKDNTNKTSDDSGIVFYCSSEGRRCEEEDDWAVHERTEKERKKASKKTPKKRS